MLKKMPGFTLVELLIVIVVITILATITTVAYSGVQANSRDNQRMTNATIVADALERYFDVNNEYPGVKAITSAGGISSVTGAQAAAILQLNDASVLVMPDSPTSYTNSLRPSPGSAGAVTTRLDYEAQPNEASCRTNTTAAGCTSFVIRWKTEAGSTQEIKSRR